MKIAQATLHTYRLAYRRTVTWSDTRETAADYVLLRLVDDSGAVGLAEATVKPTWSGFNQRTMVETVRELYAPLLRSHLPSDEGGLGAALRRIPDNAQARGLVETALWTLALSRGELGAAPAQAVGLPVSCTLTRQPPPLMAQQAARWRERFGVGCFKLKGGQGLATDAEGVRAVLNAVPAARVYVDANWAYAAGDLTRYADALAEAGATLLEDPCHFTPAGFQTLAARCALPLMVDFAARDADLAAHYCRAGAHAVSVKPGRYGVAEALQVAQAAREAGRGCCLGLFGESDLGTAINLRIAGDPAFAATVLPAELTFFLELKEQALTRPLVLRHGRLELPSWDETLQSIDHSRMQTHACF